MSIDHQKYNIHFLVDDGPFCFIHTGIAEIFFPIIFEVFVADFLRNESVVHRFDLSQHILL